MIRNIERGKLAFADHEVLANGSLALAPKSRVGRRELPGGRGLLREDGVTPAIKVKVLGFVADLRQRAVV